MSPTRDADVADKPDACVMEMLYTSGACQVLVCSGVLLKGILGHCQVLPSGIRKKQGRTPLKLHTTHRWCH